jgi:phosphatidylserine/phosphatidylglycerophosphate/cardiolipin synthase-like enzyme
MKLIIEPEHGVAPILSAIQSAKESIELTIFRFDRKDIEAALTAAVSRGVKVTALVAYANRGGEKLLRKLETRFLQAGIIVARTADDLIRYHSKVVIIDRSRLYVLSLNFTTSDMVRSRGFAVSTENPRLVQEAVKLFEADCTRKEYVAGLPNLIVSPANARKELGTFIRRARQQLLIYDPRISDGAMTRLIQERIKAGIEVRIIGQATESGLKAKKLKGLQLHTRTIIRDGQQAFVGSQSLRATELDRRREVGLILRERRIVKTLAETFEVDWAATASASDERAVEKSGALSKKEQDKVSTVLIHELLPIAAQVKRTVRKVVDKAGDEALRDEKVKNTVKKVVKRAVKDAVKEVAEEVENGSRKTPQWRTLARTQYSRKTA